MKESIITIKVNTDEAHLPTEIEWQAAQAGVENWQKAKSLILSLWDGDKNNAMRIDLWTNQMKVNEMADFYYQTFLTLADSFERATNYRIMAEEMRAYAQNFFNSFQNMQKKEG